MGDFPYGGVINWRMDTKRSVHDPSVHHGYRHMVAWSVWVGSHAYYTEDQCWRAKQEGAPKDAIFMRSPAPHEEEAPREWVTFSSLRTSRTDFDGRQMVEAMEKYVKQIERMEQARRTR
jgi:hypothetical protein